jgi:small subunit ribosomal protein S8
MTMTDPVSDLLTRIRNASEAGHETVNIPLSRLKLEIARILKEEGYISNYSLIQDDKQGVIRVQLRYAGKSDIPSVLGGLGICIVSTSQGVLTGKQAQEKGLGGEVLCAIS